MTKVTLVTPNERKYLGNAGDRMPLGVLYLASALNDADIENDVVDMNHTHWLDTIDKIKDEKPDVVGLSLVSSMSYPQMKVLAEEIRPYTDTIVAGGHHVSALPHSLDGVVDAVVLGDGENGIIRVARDGWKGIMRQEFNINEFPIPDRTKLDISKYKMEILGLKTAPMTTMRGCPFSCIEENQKIWFSRKPNDKIKNAKIGDKIISLNEKLNILEEGEIKNIKIQEKELFEIELEDGKKLKLTDDHKVFTTKGWKQVKKLLNTDKILSFNFNEKISFNKKILNPMKNKLSKEKMIDTTRKRGWYKKSSERMKNLWKNKKLPTNTKQQIIARHKSKNKKENNGMWKNDKNDRNFSNLKNIILEDKYVICAWCNSNKHLCVHHIDENNKNDNLNNLVIICKSCHSKIHKIERNFK